MVCGLVAFRKNIDRRGAQIEALLPMRRNKSRIPMETSPKSMSTGQGDAHLWHTVQ